MKVFWSDYIIGRAFRKRQDRVIIDLVAKYEHQPRHKLLNKTIKFMPKEITKAILEEGGWTFVAVWVDIWGELPEDYVNGCDISVAIDDYYSFIYGYGAALFLRFLEKTIFSVRRIK